MASIDLIDDTVRIRFSPGEKLAGLLRTIDLPVSAVTDVTVVAEPLAAVRGIRAPGLAIPGRRKIGTWRGRGHKAAVCVRAGVPAVRVTASGARYDEILISTSDAEAVAGRISDRLGRR